MTDFLASLVAAVVAGLGVGGVAAAVSVRLQLWRQLDLVPAVAAVAVALAARELGGTGRAGAVGDGILLIPVAGAIGYLVALFLGDRLRFRTDPAQSLPVAVAVALVGDQFLRTRVEPAASTLTENSTSLWSLGDTSLVTLTMFFAAIAAVGAVLAVWLWLGVGRTGRLLRAWREDPEVPLLFGLDPTRLGARLAGLTTAVGAAGGLAYASVTPISGASTFDVFVAAAEALLVGGTRSILRVMGAAVVLELIRVGTNKVAGGWGPVVVHGIAVGFALWRARRGTADRVQGAFA